MNRIYIETINPENDKRTNEFRFFEYLIQKLNLQCEIIGIGGKTKISEFENQFKDTTLNGFKNLVIIDADGNWNTKNWSINSEIKKLNEIKTKFGVDFETFLLPLGNIKGDFETLLESIINQEHSGILNCHQDFENCIEKYGRYLTPNRKARIYSYITSFKKSKSENEEFKNKGNWFFDNSEYWDFDSKSLKPLKNFLKKHLT